MYLGMTKRGRGKQKDARRKTTEGKKDGREKREEQTQERREGAKIEGRQAGRKAHPMSGR
jgi:hypothetical protein